MLPRGALTDSRRAAAVIVKVPEAAVPVGAAATLGADSAGRR